MHRRADVEIEPLLLFVEGCDRIANSECRTDCSLGIVFVSDGCSEEGDDRVPDELLDGASEPLELST